VLFWDVSFDAMPPVYLARPAEIAGVMKAQAKGRGWGALSLAATPVEWRLTPERLASLWSSKPSLKLSEAA
jgi:hypothetical protein